LTKREGGFVADERIELMIGDITDVEAGAIVNAANNELQLGGGVAGAIRRKGGPSIQEECDCIGPIPLGEAAVTRSGRLKAKVIIHAASMALGQTTTAENLVASTRNSLLRADEHKLASIAFPAIGTGIAGFPLDDCARLMIGVVREHLASADTTLRKVIFVPHDQAAHDAFAAELARTA
jgi:O-acetyl-ADP-ribose deacetylase (regulator of RNase III)